MTKKKQMLADQGRISSVKFIISEVRSSFIFAMLYSQVLSSYSFLWDSSRVAESIPRNPYRLIFFWCVTKQTTARLLCRKSHKAISRSFVGGRKRWIWKNNSFKIFSLWFLVRSIQSLSMTDKYSTCDTQKNVPTFWDSFLACFLFCGRSRNSL